MLISITLINKNLVIVKHVLKDGPELKRDGLIAVIWRPVSGVDDVRAMAGKDDPGCLSAINGLEILKSTAS